MNKQVDEILTIGLALIVYKLVSMLTLIADVIMPICLALIVYKLVSMLTLIADVIMPIGLALIVYKLVSVLTLIAYEIQPIGMAMIVYKSCLVLILTVKWKWVVPESKTKECANLTFSILNLNFLGKSEPIREKDLQRILHNHL